ncbi:propionate catabolism operon regulatory protein PrpR [Eoetvoesiella caeni]|uniref:Propionate catabolism operon transcriptional regulator n=1 Tax=Eoetvoesiella caeni TaxID=645616 RepID=A0A366H880_9BURK|nr:propionate catabolism operon regulatory protein PrpR [Eoetvoesiella caeni]MCI2809971.1 propionate catabolism operon regulatory protein PrpR [Eoetvoesiella caeni]NYT55847.1 propionate catabolism operon regulatory protein PrpR [Eoetvoesiella caeni]RBP37542.1 propionate catabolism operon transcriptional regulator [Eoetvoesiella caeni]
MHVNHTLPTSVSVPTPALRIVAVGFHGLRALLEELAPQYYATADVHILDKTYGDALADITALRRHPGVDAVVAAGSNGGFLRQNLDLPVVLVKVGGFDAMHALTKASRHSRRIALVTYGAVAPEVSHFNEVFGLQVVLRAYRTEQDAEVCVQELKYLGIEVVVAPGMVVDLARAYGLEGVLLYSQESVREAIEDAIEVARISRLELAKREKLGIILGQLKDGVVAVDLEERIEVVNASMEKILGQPAGQLMGQRLASVSPELSLQNTLRSGQAEVEQVQEVGGRTLVTTRLPVTEQGRYTGAVLVCQDQVMIQRLDRNLRARAQPRTARAKYLLSDIIGQSASIAQAKARALICAHSQSTVLIVGESGTGKELLAQGIHNAGSRRGQAFVAINCAAFPEALLESELFGYVEGAFTGSSRGGKTGLFEAAHRGTVFLDEIGEMPLSLQTRLLRVLQEKEVLRIGSTAPIPIDVRVVAATHQDLAARIQAGQFRSDLYYRLNVLSITLPPLRERREDLPLLAAHLKEKVARRLGHGKSVDDGVVDAIVAASQGYAWPGNIRELENLIERLAAFHGAAGMGAEAVALELQAIAPELAFCCTTPGNDLSNTSSSDDLRDSREAAELQRIQAALKECNGDRARAAEILGISRSTLWRKLKRAGAQA